MKNRMKRGHLWDVFDPETRDLEIERVDFPENGDRPLASDDEALGLVLRLAVEENDDAALDALGEVYGAAFRVAVSALRAKSKDRKP